MAYTIVKGDTLSAIAKANDTTVEELLRLNPYITDPGKIFVGKEIKLPGEDEPVVEEPVEDGEETTIDPSPAPKPEGETATVPGVMGGGTLTKISRTDQDDLWGIAYTHRGTTHFYTFDTYDAMLAALGEDAVTSGTYGFTSMTEADFDTAISAGSLYQQGSATPLVGQSGTYAEMMTDIERDAAIAAGVRDPGKIGEYLANPEVQAIMAAAASGDWTDEQLQAELRTTSYYLEVLYPGISSLLDQGVSSPEATWWSYHDSVKDSLDSLGYERDDDGTYRSHVGKMMDHGISDTTFTQMAPVYRRAKDSPEFAIALDYWLDDLAGRDVTFDDIYDAMDGQASGDLALATERAVIQYQSELHSTTLTDDQVKRIAAQTDMSEAEIKTSFTTAEEYMLGLGDRGLSRYGLTEAGLVSSAFGLGEDGETATEIRRLAQKTMKELGLQDDKKAQFYASFGARGQLVKPGLKAVTPEIG